MRNDKTGDRGPGSGVRNAGSGLGAEAATKLEERSRAKAALRESTDPRYVPLSTYRLQVHAGFPLTAARDIVPYLRRLGVDVCYTSPYFTAEPGSTHGYDVCNHNEINPEVGGIEAHTAFTDALHAAGMGHLVDFVPNHMGIATATNLWWRDVLENGPSSPSARFFDIDWSPVKTELHAKLLLPILGDQYGSVLERGELQLEYRNGVLVLHYFDHELPINPRQAPRVFRIAAERLADRLGPEDPRLHEFLSIIASLENMPGYTAQDPGQIAERHREKEVARARLARLAEEESAVREEIERAVQEYNGRSGDAASFDRLHDLLERQAYRLSYWRTASHQINYRRFFDVNGLAGLRVEDAEVFKATHTLLAQMIKDGRVSAVRIDHPDGLFDPAGYFEMLQDLAADGWGVARRDGGGRRERPLYVVAEKILSGREQLPFRWAVHGTTGYNFLNDLNGIFVDASQARRARRVYTKLTAQSESFDDVLYVCKRLIMETAMASELSVLAHMLARIAQSNRKSRDFTLESLRDVITEVVACFPAYRTYVDEHGWTAEDRVVVQTAIARARRRNPAMEASLFDFFWEVMLPRDIDDRGAVPAAHERRRGYPPADTAEARERRRFAMKLQQYTGPVQAKGLEDTAFYRYNVLLSLNEVGGDPSRFGRSLQDFHDANVRRQRDWPYEQLSTSTHDTKISEDVRARINAISEMPDDWGREVARWMRGNRSHRTIVDGEPAPDRVDEYRFYQALAGVWSDAGGATAAPAALVERLKEFMIKSVREAKVHTSWLTVHDEYEQAVVRFVERVLGGQGAGRFLPGFASFHRVISRLGRINAIAQLALKIGSPGVPDFYQGSELWDFSLVDPDNRRPVDFAARARALEDVDAVLAHGVGDSDLSRWWQDGRIKLLVTAAGLRLRRAHPDLFLRGEYVPLATEVTVKAGAVAFARLLDDRAAVFVVPRLCASVVSAERPLPLGGDTWMTSRVMLPPALRDRTFRHEITGAEIRPTQAADAAWLFLGQVFETVPVGILTAR
jgi:(1->4)-alpha-D-glucan 1-alpha-D-glucosylmutase